MKILHTADLHYNDRDHDEIEKCVDFMISVACDEEPDLIVVSGDITDSQNLKLDSRSAKTICRQFSELADIAPVAVIIGTPSHDGRSAEILRWVRGNYSIHVSEKPEQLYLFDGRLVDFTPPAEHTPDAIITQIPTPTKQFLIDHSGAVEDTDRTISTAMTSIFGAFGAAAAQLPSVPHVLSGHFQMGGAYISETQQLVGRDIEISTDQIAMANAHVNCLGHIHKQQKLGRNTFYSGSIYRKNFGEMEDKGFYIHEIKRAELDECYLDSSAFIRTPTRKLVKVNYDFVKNGFLEGSDANTQLLHAREDRFRDCPGSHIKLEIKVHQDEAGKINQAELERHLEEEMGAERVVIDITRIPRVNVRAEKVLKLEGLPDKVQEMGRLRLEDVPKTVLDKAGMLETMNPEEITAQVGGIA